MTHVALQPSGNAASREHYADTIENPVAQDLLASYLSEQDMAELRDIYEDRPVPTWGVTPGQNEINVGKWNRLGIGSVTLFAAEGRVFASGVVTKKIHNPDLAHRLWTQQEDGQTWEYMYFLDEIHHHSIPYAELNDVVGYAPNYVVQGFNVLDAEKSARILSTFELESSIHFPMPEGGEANAEPIIDVELILDREGKTLMRGEQAQLRRLMFGRQRVGTCALCGREFPVELLVAAHLKKRSRCSDYEKRDLGRVAAPMCRFGCDEMYERGLVAITEGDLAISPGVTMTPAVKEFLDRLKDRVNFGFPEGSEQYLSWHLDNVYKG